MVFRIGVEREVKSKYCTPEENVTYDEESP